MIVPSTLAAPADEARSYVIPKGNFLIASPALSQMDEQVWKDAEKWDPYRWTDPSGVAAKALASYDGQGGEKIDYGYGQVSKGTESTYQPFGAGRHRCIGEQVRDVRAVHDDGAMLMASSLASFSSRISSSAPSFPP
jgi:sterol 14-demethylase